MNSKFINYNLHGEEMVEYRRQNGDVVSLLVLDEGYEPIYAFEELLLQNFDCKLVSSYGLTDMARIYLFENKYLTLRYDESNDMVCIERNILNDNDLQVFRELVCTLKKNFKGYGNEAKSKEK